MTRRGLLLACAALPLCADDAQEIWDLFTALAAALSAGNSAEFLRHFDRSMPGYEMLQRDVTALVLQADLHSSIELLGNEGHSVELDWYLQVVQKEDAGGSAERRERVRCRLEKQNKRWRIVSFAPLSFFTPPEPVP